MKKTTFSITLIFYALSVFMILYGLFYGLNHKWAWVLLGGNIMILPWLICLLNSVKNKNSINILWIYFLFFTGFIAMPIYLIKIVTEKRIS